MKAFGFLSFGHYGTGRGPGDPDAGRMLHDAIELSRGADELGDSVEPFFVDVVDGAVAQELVCHDERSSGLHGRAGRA